MIQKVQQVQSHESKLLQLTDLFIGSLSYLPRDIDSSNSEINSDKSHS